MSETTTVKHKQGNVSKRATGFVHVRPAGPIGCHAYTIAGAIRLGNVTLVVTDRRAARAVLKAALIFDDLTTRLGPTYLGRFPQQVVRPNDVTALVEMRGTQHVGDLELRSRVDRCGEATLTLGSVRLTVCDRGAAEQVAKALADGYGEATHRFTHLRSFAEHRNSRDQRRAANKARRRGIIAV